MPANRTERNLDAEYAELSYGALSKNPDTIPQYRRHQIRQWECRHCDFVLTPDRSKGNFGRVSHGRAEMRKHIRENHAEVR